MKGNDKNVINKPEINEQKDGKILLKLIEIEEDIDYGGKDKVDQDLSEDEDFAITSLSKYSKLIKVGNQTDDYKFDRFIEQLQEIVIEKEFENLRNTLFEKYCGIFEDSEENKLIYTDIFKEYVEKLETYIETVD